MHKIRVGDKVILETTTRNKSVYRWVTVTFVGRKYFKVDALEFDIETLRAKKDRAGWRSDSEIHSTYGALKAQLTHEALRSALRLKLGTEWSKDILLTPTQLLNICAVLGIDNVSAKVEEQMEGL